MKRRIRWYGHNRKLGDNVETKAQFIDVTPKWADIVETMLILYRDVDSASSRDSIVHEFRRMAEAADAYNAIAKGEK